MNTDSFVVHRKRDNIYKYIAENVEARFEIPNYELNGHYRNEKTRQLSV